MLGEPFSQQVTTFSLNEDGQTNLRTLIHFTLEEEGLYRQQNILVDDRGQGGMLELLPAFFQSRGGITRNVSEVVTRFLFSFTSCIRS